MCPSSLSPTLRHLSIFTLLPTTNKPILDLSKVSLIAVTIYSSPLILTTVKQTPLCATLWSIFNSEVIVDFKEICTLLPSLSTLTTSAICSIIPVNILIIY